MASFFGMIKKIFGGGGSAADSQAEPRAASSAPADPVMTLQEDVREVAESVSAVASTRAEYVAEQATEFVEETAAAVSEVAGDVISGAQQEAAEISADVESISDGVADAIGGDEVDAPAAEMGIPVTNLSLDERPKVINRDEFNLPRSEIVAKLMPHMEATYGKAAVAKGLRIYEYAIASSLAFDWRVDRELLLISAMFAETGADAGTRATAFAVDAGMWEALAARIGEAIDGQASAHSLDEPETRALALGLKAEAAGGDAGYINRTTAAETVERNSL